AALAGRAAVVGPGYARVGIEAVVAAEAGADPGVVVDRVRSAMAAFLHPLTGGPDRRGWGSRHSVYLSDVAAIATSVTGVDHLASLLLLDRGSPGGDALEIRAGRIVAAGPLRVRLEGDD
ncbi:MAG: hypothetical protein ABW195_11610, partial [Ilumatobacteraceae bacterium]